MGSVFFDPAHDHAHCAEAAITNAENVCAKRAQRLTPIRRRVLKVLAASHRPLGAYEIMNRLGEGGEHPAPITVYRALEFLVANGFVHRIESRNAYLACVRHHVSGAAVVFLICERCGVVGEACSQHVAASLASAARGAGFRPAAPVIEISGVCSHCGQGERN